MAPEPVLGMVEVLWRQREEPAVALREPTMAPETRRLVQLTVEAKDEADATMDMLLAKKRASDRREWLETKGNLAEVLL